ncbi:MAG: hypothetical protein R3A47_03085 [Polyangiales bacterium]
MILIGDFGLLFWAQPAAAQKASWSTTRAVVVVSITVLIADALLTQIFVSL